MRDVVTMAIVEGRDELVEVPTGNWFGEAVVGAAREFAKEITAFGEFHNQVDLGFCSHDFMDPKDVGVVQASHGLDFLHNTGLHGWIGLGLVDDFDSHGLVVVVDRSAMVDLREASTA